MNIVGRNLVHVRGRLRNEIEMLKTIGFPCRYMRFNPFGYHSCAILTGKFKDKMKQLNRPNDAEGEVLCTGHIGFYTDLEKWSKDDVPHICPLRFTYDEIQAKLQLLSKLIDWDNRPLKAPIISLNELLKSKGDLMENAIPK